MAADERIPSEVMRDAMLESLRRQAPSQYLNFQIYVAQVLAERGLPVQPGAHGAEARLRGIDERRFREALWQLINQGVLVQGVDASNAQWPWLSLTELGADYVRDGGPDAYDPDGYIAALNADQPLDEIEERYLRQASAALRVDLSDAAAVMVGAASEHLLLQLGAAIATNDPAVTSKIEKALSQPALRLHSELRKYFEPRRTKLPRSCAENFETTFMGVAALIRASRNEGGHPALPAVTRDDALVALRLFPMYRRWVYAVIAALPL